jgi:hypothetical protein
MDAIAKGSITVEEDDTLAPTDLEIRCDDGVVHVCGAGG